MTLSTSDYLSAISLHSFGFAEAARNNLAAPVEHCPGWSVADLVAHLTEVHWFWATIVEERLDAPPKEERRPARVDDDRLIDAFIAGSSRLVEVLSAADQAASCWTWAPDQQDVAFVTRHQVQEAAVHHWDAAHARNRSVAIDPEVAADAIEEFLTVSVSSDADAAEPVRPDLDGRFALQATDLGQAWTVTDGSSPGTVRFESGPGDAPTLEAPASELLLWLYRRVDLDTSRLPQPVLERFRDLCFTD